MKSLSLFALPVSLLSIVVSGVSSSPGQAELTITQQRLVDSASQIIVEQVEESSCEEFYTFLEQQEQSRGQYPRLRQRLIQAAENNPEIREEFVRQIAAPVVNKMFDCGLILQSL